MYEIDFDPWEEEFAERLNEENRARDIRNRREEHPQGDAYEERQIERFDMVGFTNKLLEQMGGAR
jgi:hypothetical protein